MIFLIYITYFRDGSGVGFFGLGLGRADFGPDFGPNFPSRNRAQSGSIEGTLANNFFFHSDIFLKTRFFCAERPKWLCVKLSPWRQSNYWILLTIDWFIFVFLFYFFLNNKTGWQRINIQIFSIAYLMNRKNYCWAESGFLIRPRLRVGFELTSSRSGRGSS